jgi:hypothetical protein
MSYHLHGSLPVFLEERASVDYVSDGLSCSSTFASRRIRHSHPAALDILIRYRLLRDRECPVRHWDRTEASAAVSALYTAVMCGSGRAPSSCHVYTPMCCVPSGLEVLTPVQILSSCDQNVFLATLRTILFGGTAKCCWYLCDFEMSWLGGSREQEGS